ncbi:MAG: hypothetical protein Q9195_006271 [Heterodermia aff. obscurata]
MLAADGNAKLLPLLRSNPSLASIQDDHGYSLLHAAASYNHIELLKSLVHEFKVDANIKDEDGETPLFVVETVEAAQILIEDLGADIMIRNVEGHIAEERLFFEGEHPTVAAFMRKSRLHNESTQMHQPGHEAVSPSSDPFGNNLHHPPPLPPNVTVNLESTEEEQLISARLEAVPEFRQRIEELAARDDFRSDQGQRQLRGLVTDALRDMNADESERSVRRRL